MRVRSTTPTEEHLIEAFKYIAEENRSAAAGLIGAIEGGARILGKRPSAGKTGRVAGTRGLAIAGTPFVVAYRIEKSELWILAVMHGARKWPKEF
jgi:toxin ParE1/3/4